MRTEAHCLAGGPVVPGYLTRTYWWAYVHPRAVRVFEREWLVNLILWGNFGRLRDAALDALGARLDGRTLQIACVYGDLTTRLAARVANGARLDVVDVLPIQLDNLARKLPRDATVELVHGDSAALPLESSSYDRALLFFLLHEQPEEVRRATIAEALRVVKPGGRLVIVDYHRPRALNPLYWPMAGVLRTLEPYALDLWQHEITEWFPHNARIAGLEKVTSFGGLYQLFEHRGLIRMQVIQTDIVVVGGGGAGLRAAIAACERNPRLRVALVSKVVPMRSHTVAAEGGAAAVTRADDSLEHHFHDTVSGGDWLCDQDVVEFFVARCGDELVQLEHWGCPWSRRPDGDVNVRFFGGMTVQRTWFAADRSGFHILHTLFQTSLRLPIKRYDEFFCADLIVEDGRVRGVLAIEVATGEMFLFECAAVVLCTGGAGRVFRQNTNAGTVTGDGMGLAYRHGVPLRDMEFVQWHPTCLPGTGILMTEACRGEGAILLNKDGYRYLQDYGLGPLDPWPRPKAMELGPRDRLSQAFWHEVEKGRTVSTPQGPAVWLDLRHLGAKKIHERLPLIAEAAQTFAGVDAVKEPIPVCPAVHYTMGGIVTNVRCETPLAGLYAAGECSSVGIHGANRLGSNSLVEILVFGKVAGESAAEHAAAGRPPAGSAMVLAEASAQRMLGLLRRDKGERPAVLRDEMTDSMEAGVGIYRGAEGIRATCGKLAQLRDRYRHGVRLDDRSRSFNTEWLTTIELGFMLEVAEAMAHSALERRESRGAHMRLDGYEARDDANFLKHTLAHHRGDGKPGIDFMPVTITKSNPEARVYGGQGKQAVLT